MVPTLYLHWTATGYHWIRPGHYHAIVGGDGRVHRLHDYSIDLTAHTWRRNSNSVALACACMGGQPDPWDQPPTDAQLEGLCNEAATILIDWGLEADQVRIERVMTHAEAASNRDGRQPHDNYGPVIWGGSGERWDLFQLERNGAIDGGDQLRNRIRQRMHLPLEHEPLSFRGGTSIDVRGDAFSVVIDETGRSWAPAGELLERYEIDYVWDLSQRRLLVAAGDVVPTFRDDAVQAEVGWPLVDMTLKTDQAPVILRGILREERVWCRVVEFAEEFGISMQFNSVVLQERRGG
ncbi:MAG: N-acetylmuramoyl-L-alanine amidase [Synechococcus sp. ARS1019]|nr:N-acetylmuramoyl-L-alanine amidase [Synechococcus sp. ARS1019]